jgi:hypothetical protein
MQSFSEIGFDIGGKVCYTYKCKTGPAVRIALRKKEPNHGAGKELAYKVNPKALDRGTENTVSRLLIAVFIPCLGCALQVRSDGFQRYTEVD